MNPSTIEQQDRITNGHLLRQGMWQKGLVSPWYCKPKQQSVVDFIRVIEDPFFEAARRFGKTTSVLAFIIEECIKNKIIVRWCEPWKNQCREIVMPEIDQIQKDIPPTSRFVWHSTDSYYECPSNSSRIYLRGVNEDKGESARGAKAHIIVCDELGSWRYPTYVISEVLGPQLLTTKGKFVFMGTAPRNGAHVYYDMKSDAESKGRFIQRLVYDQEIVEWEEVEKAVERAGGWKSAAVQREYLCKKVADPNFAIIPEWDDKYIQTIPQDEFFKFYCKYDGLDIGVRDQTVNLFGYYDFKRAACVILDEVVLFGKDMTTERLAEETRAKEELYFKVKFEQYEEKGKMRWRMIKPGVEYKNRRISDIDLLFLNDMPSHGLFFEPTDKGHLDEMTNELRIWVSSGRVLVHPRCKTLIDCLRYGIWDEDRKQWERADRLGHFDALAALMYLVRNIDTRTNPIPPTFGRPEDEYFYGDESLKQTNREKLKKAFGVPKFGLGRHK